jgi:hypothetical protein
MIPLGIIAIVFTSFYMIFNKYGNFIFRLADGLFIIGLIYLLIAFSFYIRNVGFFKLIAYNKYRRKYMKTHYSKKEKLDKDLSHEEEMMELHEFCEEHYSEKWSSKALLIYAIPLLIASIVLSYFA